MEIQSMIEYEVKMEVIRKENEEKMEKQKIKEERMRIELVKKQKEQDEYKKKERI